MATCGRCNGGPESTTCLRCLGAGHVGNDTLAHALEAWRWLREKARERDGLATLAATIMTSERRHRIAEAVFVDVGLLVDTLDGAAVGGRALMSGSAAWLGDRWHRAVIEQDAVVVRGSVFVHDRFFVSQHRRFWGEVCPDVVDLLREDVQLDLPLLSA